LRPKARSDDEYNAFFYSLVSKDTEEMYFSAKRRQFLIDQGYSYKVLSSLPLEQEVGLHFETGKAQQEWLAKVLSVAESEGQEENIEDEDEEDLFAASGSTPSVSRNVSSGKSLTGGTSATYIETAKSKKQHPIFQKLHKGKLK
jgi:DNA excision repair protein ERCC-3